MAGENHPSDDEIQEALDLRLPAAERLELEAHLASCGECRGTWESLAWAKAQAGALGRPDTPGDLAARIARSLDEEDEHHPAARGSRQPQRIGARPLWMLAGLAAVLLLAFLMAPRSDMPQAVARDHDALRRGALALDLRSADIAELEAHFARAPLPFPVRVLDLAMMRYRLVGGTVQRRGDQPRALLLYEGADGHLLLCEMYRAALADLPPGGEAHEHGGIPFRTFQRGAVTLAFWPEGDVLCVLAGEGGLETVLPLAFAKAMKATET